MIALRLPSQIPSSSKEVPRIVPDGDTQRNKIQSGTALVPDLRKSQLALKTLDEPPVYTSDPRAHNGVSLTQGENGNSAWMG